MKKDRIVYRGAIGIFLISILVIAYASYQIIYSKNKVKKNLGILDSIERDKNIKNSSGDTGSNQTKVQEDIYSNHGIMGKLIIERTKKVLPIVEGTTEDKLKSGAGHYEHSFAPGESGNCVIFGHRDGVFSNLEEVKINDIITIETDKGKFIYKVISTEITEPKEEEVIKECNEAMLTLVTCYPFGYVGSAPKRFIVVAKLGFK
ncbi:class D sortase [Clostridium sp. CX1]|uniref:class D sortase n=1 Tax=Clostridium sp. CX1 TaxID=2978346 RepID=UPI0021C0E24F|nr:class D sortase [Clostridium sp. CX1]MCT8978551.1 class D sortase [Clostridium sp. CX1]